jgi:uncharacterized protein YjiS (DUF1127 family)
MNTDCQESNPCRRAIEAAAPALAPYSIWVAAAQEAFAFLLRSSVPFSTWMKRGRHRRALDRLSDHTMKDIGLARTDPDGGWHRLL